MANTLEGVAGTIRSSFYLYYYTFVAELTDAQIAIWIAAVPIIGLTFRTAMAVVWGRVFSSKKHTPRMYTVAGRVLDAISHMIIFGTTTSIEGFLCGIIMHMILFSPRSFWSMSARGWIIDEDAHAMAGRRRESLFTGVSSAVAKLSAPVAAAIIAGQAIAGIDTTQPRSFQQPQSGVWYIRSIYIFVCPAFDLAQAYAIYHFPIRGERLCTLEKAQATSFKALLA